MVNKEQVRARNALAALNRLSTKNYKGESGGDILTGFPALIVNNGILATIAYCLSKSERGKKSGHELICDEISQHLADPDINCLVLLQKNKEPDTQSLLDFLVNSNSDKLRLCTSEALAYLNFLRRFAK